MGYFVISGAGLKSHVDQTISKSHVNQVNQSVNHISGPDVGPACLTDYHSYLSADRIWSDLLALYIPLSLSNVILTSRNKRQHM